MPEQEKGLIVRGDRQVAIQELETRFAMAVRQRELLEQYIKERLSPGRHFYKISRGDAEESRTSPKPSLTKEGAELICLPHNLKPGYEILSGPENPPMDDSPYQITVRCELRRGENFEGQGIGSASSMITKRTGERVQRQRDPGLRHNATLKMACKSAYIAATLNATAASEFFTQDLEDDQTDGEDKERPGQLKSHWCSIHNTAFFKKGKMKGYAHPIGDSDEWCNEDESRLRDEPKTPGLAPQSTPGGSTTEVSPVAPEVADTPPKIRGIIELDWLRENMAKAKWTDKTALSWIRSKANYAGLDFSGNLTDVIDRMNTAQAEFLVKEIQMRVELS